MIYNDVAYGRDTDTVYAIEITLQVDNFRGKLRSKLKTGKKVGLQVINTVTPDIIYHLDEYECIEGYVKLSETRPKMFEYKFYNKTLVCHGHDLCSDFYKYIVGIEIVELTHIGSN